MMIEQIERLQRELVAMRDYNQGYLDRRASRGITTDTDTTKARHQETLAETLDLLEAIKAEKRSCAEGEPL
jgi:hypothetical protein